MQRSLAAGIFWAVILLFGHAQAMVEPSAEMIREAQEYGAGKASADAETFLAPWRTYEDNVGKLDADSERAYFYSPYLLIAADSREKTIQNKKVTLEDAEKVLNDYQGCAVIAVFLVGSDSYFPAGATVHIMQAGRQVPVYRRLVPDKAGKLSADTTDVLGSEPRYSAKCFFYIQTAVLEFTRPLTIKIEAGDGARNFFFDLAKIK